MLMLLARRLNTCVSCGNVLNKNTLVNFRSFFYNQKRLYPTYTPSSLRIQNMKSKWPTKTPSCREM
jgi:hypothetical protein